MIFDIESLLISLNIFVKSSVLKITLKSSSPILIISLIVGASLIEVSVSYNSSESRKVS